jgi:hypothetical protein
VNLLDYVFVADLREVIDIFMAEPELAYSDHLPVVCTLTCNVANCTPATVAPHCDSYDHALRWDHADVSSYYESTRVKLEPIQDSVIAIDGNLDTLARSELIARIESTVGLITESLLDASDSCIPAVKRNFLQHWWSCELTDAKRECVFAHREWVSHVR